VTSVAGQLRPAEAPSDGVQIRHLRTHAEFVACVELQAATWGAGFSERVPATILRVSQRLGGVTAGAFARDNTLLGFVFGITGLEHGTIVHWSDMLAVRSGMQNHGIGRRLKHFQCESVRKLGATRMYWTFDPLVARNAHFNLNRLGVRVSEYVPDMYGADTGSVVHSGLGTDRFIVVLPIASEVAEAPRGSGIADTLVWNIRHAPILNEATAEGRTVNLSRFDADLPPTVRIEIPPDISRIQSASSAQAAHWRVTTRLAFQWALANGYTVERFERDGADGFGCYVLTLAAFIAPPSGA